MRHPSILGLLLLQCLLTACNNAHDKQETPPVRKTPPVRIVHPVVGKDSMLSTDVDYYADSVFKGNKNLLQSIFSKYVSDTCVSMIYDKQGIKDGFEGFNNIGDVNNNGKPDSVFVLDELSWCDFDHGKSYYFTDTSLPRLVSESYCAHPTNFFIMPDVDEDGIKKVGYFYSSCASRYKSLRFFRLNNGKWQQIGVSEFDQHTQDPEKTTLSSLVRKISRNRFAAKNFYDGEIYWDTLEIK